MHAGLQDINRMLLRAFAAGDTSPMECTIASLRKNNDGDTAPITRIMTVFEVVPEGVVMFSNPGAKVDELRADPRVSLTLWFPLLGGIVTVEGTAQIGKLVPPPRTPPGQEPPCPCEVPSGFPITVCPSVISITDFVDGKFERRLHDAF